MLSTSLFTWRTGRTVTGVLAMTLILPFSGEVYGGAAAGHYRVGAAGVDITPDYPIRLSGYAARQSESEGIEQRLWAKALAIEDKQTRPAVLVTVDNCVVPAWITEEVAGRLERRAGIARERFALTCTHTHSAPYLKGGLATLFGRPLPEDHQARVDRYSRELIDHLEKVALEALDARRPAHLAWGCGEVGFAINRRAIRGRQVQIGVNPEGPVDHSLPVLGVRDPDGRLRAVVVNYACHCTTVQGNFNRICGDWAGYAQEYVERDHPGAVCLVTIGCGGDANPHPRGELEHARQYGQEIATEVNRLLKKGLAPIDGQHLCRFERIGLPYENIPDREVWAKRAAQDDYVGYHARMQLARLDRGESLPTHLDYPVQVWAFGEDLAMVFLAGEVVVDYALRLKREFDGRRLWVTAYANDVPCYIPSKRVLAEGGYEAEGAMTYYDRPARLAPATEDRIVETVGKLLPEPFKAEPEPAVESQ